MEFQLKYDFVNHYIPIGDVHHEKTIYLILYVQNKKNHPYQLLNLLAIAFSQFQIRPDQIHYQLPRVKKEFLLLVPKPVKLTHFSYLKTHHEHR